MAAKGPRGLRRSSIALFRYAQVMARRKLSYEHGAEKHSYRSQYQHSSPRIQGSNGRTAQQIPEHIEIKLLARTIIKSHNIEKKRIRRREGPVRLGRSSTCRETQLSLSTSAFEIRGSSGPTP